LTPTTMRGLRFHRHGGPEVLVWDELAVPEPGPGQVLVRSRGFAVNWADLMERAGTYPGAPDPPYVVGHDLAGDVVALGPGTEGPAVGTRVFGLLAGAGTAAEWLVAGAHELHRVPDALSDAEAAGLGSSYLTADAAIVTMGHLEPGETVLVHAAAGGFGSAAVQLCKAYGAGTVIATAGSPAKLERVAAIGADVTVDYTTEDFVEVVREVTGGRGVDLVIESVGGDVLGRSFDCLRPVGRLVSVGASSGRSTSRFRLHTLFETGVTVGGFTLGLWLKDHPELIAPSVERILRVLDGGTIHPLIGAVYAPEQIAEAHEFLASRRSVGRTIVLFPPS
jgi:NADPH2:quinone reductase